MARADELEHDEKIIHPVTEQHVRVEHVTLGLSWAKVYFKAHGQRGMFKCLPHTEIKTLP